MASSFTSLKLLICLCVKIYLALRAVIQIPEFGNICFWNPESWALIGIRRSARGIQNLANDWNPKGNLHWQGIWYPAAKIGFVQQKITNKRAVLWFEFLFKRFGPGPSPA